MPVSSEHSYEVSIACRLGVPAAVIYHEIAYWCGENAKSGRNIFDGRAWTYNSVRAYKELFPEFSTATINNALRKLESDGLIISGNYNRTAYDKTKWYSSQIDLSESANGLPESANGLPESANGLSDSANGFAKKSEPIPSITSENPIENPIGNLIGNHLSQAGGVGGGLTALQKAALRNIERQKNGSGSRREI